MKQDGNDSEFSKPEQNAPANELAAAIENAISKLGQEDENGDIAIWNAIENDAFKIMIVHKGVMKAVGFTDAGIQFYNDEEKENGN